MAAVGPDDQGRVAQDQVVGWLQLVEGQPLG